jgi:hypothetical protein
MVLLMAGHEASVNAASNGVAAFAAHPDQWQLLRAGTVPMKSAIEEILRWDPPLQFFQRWVLDDGFEVRGVQIPRGSKVGLMIGSSNRDPEKYENPDSLLHRCAAGTARTRASLWRVGGGAPRDHAPSRCGTPPWLPVPRVCEPAHCRAQRIALTPLS